jgi:hypothetical protein
MKRIARGWVLIALCALVASAFLQRRNEHRRIEAKLTYSNPDKDALETGLMALGGFRGLAADALWVRMLTQQESGQYYDQRAIGEIILKLQPTFSQVHSSLSYSLTYNMANKADGCEEKWYWIRSGIAMMERGLERNHRSHQLWYELGYYYLQRLSENGMRECRDVVLRELPRIENVPEEERRLLFSHGKYLGAGSGRPDEHLRWAAYCYWRALQTGTDPMPFRTERAFAACLELLGHWRSKKPPEECKAWEDWGAEEFWVELLKKKDQRPDIFVPGAEEKLRFLMIQQMDTFVQRGDQAASRAAYERLKKYIPSVQKPYEQLLAEYREYVRKAKEQSDRTKQY